jgi:branched-chain amino acid transport system permease protein
MRAVALAHRLHARIAIVAVVMLCLLPWLLHSVGQDYYISFATRVLVFALAATSLNLVVGFGGMVSFAHAAFFGAGSYAVAILMEYGVSSLWISFPVAILAGAGIAALVGALSLRTRGVYFIMITLAFAQMAFYLVVSLKGLGGDDGMTLPSRSTIAGTASLKSDAVLYFAALTCLAAGLWVVHRLINSPLGRALQGARENELRMQALGYPVFHVRLIAFIVSGGIAGLAGALLANQGGLASPNILYWHQSGMLLVMVIAGGVGSLYGGVAGAAALLLCEELFVGITLYGQLAIGILLLLLVLFAPRGIAGLFARRGT